VDGSEVGCANFYRRSYSFANNSKEELVLSSPLSQVRKILLVTRPPFGLNDSFVFSLSVIFLRLL